MDCSAMCLFIHEYLIEFQMDMIMGLTAHGPNGAISVQMAPFCGSIISRIKLLLWEGLDNTLGPT